ncbi:MAG: CYTH domain-containing protein [Methylococcales bacterium]
MPVEIEHKFLVANDGWRQHVSATAQYQQGYLTSDPTSSIRVRIDNTQAWLNIKSATIGNHRHEYEYPIPLTDAQEILENLCKKPLITKIRHFIIQGSHTWEIDEFQGENQGLCVAEIELAQIDEVFEKPSWLGKDVTDDLRYYNNNLAQHPYSEWKDT